MGMCVSCEPKPTSTAKVIHSDGTLQEFTYPVKVSYVLSNNPTTFLCNSDDMDFDDVALAVGDDEVLQPGQLYFALPLTKLRRPLPAEEMAALAVRANDALLKSGGRSEKCCRRKSKSGGFFVDGKVMDGGDESVKIGRSRSGDRNRSGKVNGRKRCFSSNLSTIME